MEMIPLFKPYMPSQLPELDLILHSGALSYGKWGRLFESKIGQYIGERQVLAVNSFNSAMLLALGVIGIEPGDEIIASPMSCLASNQPFVTQHAKVVWADIDPVTGSLLPDSVSSKITTKTRAIFHNHFCGYPGYIDEINTIGKDNGILVVDDAIEAFGTEYKGNKIGNTGADITVFSFQTVRLPNTVDGGAIAFKDEELYNKAIQVRDYGIDRTKFRTSNAEINIACDINIPGFGCTLSEINSYIGCLQMDIIDELLSIQRENAKKWIEILKGNYFDLTVLNYDKQNNPNFWVFAILTSSKQKLMEQFRTDGYYASGVHLPNNYYSVFGEKVQLKGVEDFYSKFIALPCGWWFDLKSNINV